MKKKYFILEIASSHSGSIKRLKKIFNQAINSEADFVKLQIFKNEYLSHKSSSLYKKLKKIQIDFRTWEGLIRRKTKKKIILEPFDDFLIKDALKNFKKVFVNISGYDEKLISNFFKKFKEYKKKIVFMYGYQAYPTQIEDLRFSFIRYLKKFNIQTGYADHSCFRKIYETYVATEKAINMGASYIEKHICTSYKERYPDYHSSFNIIDFNDYVKFFKKKLFSYKKKISTTEKKYCKVMNKFAVLNENVIKSEKISLKKIIFLRIGEAGLKWSDVYDLIKK